MKKRKPLSLPIFLAIYLSVAVACVALDQLSKHFIEIAVKNNGGRIRILGDWLTLVWTTNSGATGGLWQNLGWQNWLFFIMTVLGIPMFAALLIRSRTRSVWGQIAFSFVIGGTIGNAIDRLFLAENGFFTGEVRDFVQVQGFFGIFNIADSFLVVGVIMALLAVIIFDYDSLLLTFLNERKQRLVKQQTESIDNEVDSLSQENITEQNADSEQIDTVQQQSVEQCDEDGSTGL